MTENFTIQFNNNILLINNINNHYENVSKNISELKTQYGELLKSKAHNNKIFLFSLDSIYSDYKFYLLELEQIDSSKKMINNRIYTEFLRLFQIMQKYLNEIKLTYENSDVRECPPLKDLDQFNEYSIDNINNSFYNILFLIDFLKKHIEKLNKEIDDCEKEYNVGFSITNLIITMKNENLLIQNQLDLFINYVSFFLTNHNKLLNRVYDRLETIISFPVSIPAVNNIIKKDSNDSSDSIITTNTTIETKKDNIELEIRENDDNNTDEKSQKPEIMYE